MTSSQQFRRLPTKEHHHFSSLFCQKIHNVFLWHVHLLDEDMSSREDASTSWPSSSGQLEVSGGHTLPFLNS
jgi:hypothetical protein